MSRATAALLIAVLSSPASAGLEQAVSAVSRAFEAAAQAPAMTLVPAFKHLRAFNDEDALIALLSDNDASVRATACKSLKNYALNSWRSENALLERAQDGRELESVRREAVKSLAWAAQHWTTRDSLVRLAGDSHETLTLRAIALKSLYVIGNDWTAQRALFDAVESGELPLRAAAAWAVAGAATSNYQAKDQLKKIVDESREPVTLRVEAVKSLYAAMTDWNVRDLVWRLAQDSGAPRALREAATLALNAANSDWNVKSWLESEARGESDPVIRTAAIKALAAGPDWELVRYFHLSYYNGRFVDPLEDQ